MTHKCSWEVAQVGSKSNSAPPPPPTHTIALVQQLVPLTATDRPHRKSACNKDTSQMSTDREFQRWNAITVQSFSLVRTPMLPPVVRCLDGYLRRRILIVEQTPDTLVPDRRGLLWVITGTLNWARKPHPKPMYLLPNRSHVSLPSAPTTSSK